MTTRGPEHERHVDEATARRLAKLGQVPFDTSKLKARVDASIEHLQMRGAGRRKRRLALVAFAVIAIGLIAGVAIWSTNSAVVASPAMLAHIHDEVRAGTTHATPVKSFDEARAVLSSKWPDGPQLPEMSGDHAVACCVCHIGHQKVACVVLQVDGVPCALAVADASTVRTDGGETLTVRGVTFHAQSHGSVNMLMTTHDNRWLCLMGELPMARLTELAGSLRL